jgi:hypothetical protein
MKNDYRTSAYELQSAKYGGRWSSKNPVIVLRILYSSEAVPAQCPNTGRGLRVHWNGLYQLVRNVESLMSWCLAGMWC